MTKGLANIILIIVGFLLAGILFGFFRKNNYFLQPVPYNWNIGFENNNENKEDPSYRCGIYIANQNLQSGPLLFPLSLTGYINNCGWNRNSNFAGSVIVYDGNNIPLSDKIPLYVTEQSKLSPYPPYFFTSYVKLNNRPTYNQGYMLFEAMPSQNGLAPGNFKIPIIFAQDYYAF